MDNKKRKGAIAVAAILALYLAGLLAQVLNNYSIWMDGGGLTGQTQMPPVEFSPMVCFPQAFTWNGLKGLLGMIVVGAIIFAYVKLTTGLAVKTTMSVDSKWSKAVHTARPHGWTKKK